ncbi:MAG: TrmH family RNA methyltransferase [Actinomycetota bacterium]
MHSRLWPKRPRRASRKSLRTTRISSLDNPRVKSARALARARTRHSEGKFLAEGRRVVMEALSSDAVVDRVFVADDPGLDDVRRAAEARDADVLEVGNAVIGSISQTTTPQGCVAVVQMPPTDVASLPPRVSLGTVLDGVRDPGNAGTVLRSAAGAGCDCVVFTKTSVDVFNPKTVRASAGSVFRTRVVTGISIGEAAAALHERGSLLVGADARAETSCFDMDLTRDVSFVLGNEAHGLGHDPLDTYARLPLPGGIESLNVAVAGSLLLFEAVRQRMRANAGLSSPGHD